MGVDALVMRHSASGSAKQVSEWVDAVVINAGDGTHEHPTQALLDAYTLQRRLGSLEGRRISVIGDLTHSRVFRSNVLLRSEEHTSELQSLMRISYAAFCLKK